MKLNSKTITAAAIIIGLTTLVYGWSVSTLLPGTAGRNETNEQNNRSGHPVDAEESEQLFLAGASRGDLSDHANYFPIRANAPGNRFAEAIQSPFQQRFIMQTEDHSPQTESDFINSVVTAYRHYWVAALMKPSSERSAAATLVNSLEALLPEAGESEQDLSVRLRQTAADYGFGLKSAATAPLMDLYLWQNQHEAHYDVELTDRTESVRVVLMEDMVVEGWSHFASLGLLSTSGWTDETGLYSLPGMYDMESEDFRVSYLKHEARHAADLRQFSDIDPVELEYRAKLTELSFLNGSAAALLRDFTRNSDTHSLSAHLRANHNVSRDMYREIYRVEMPAMGFKWREISPVDVNSAAQNLLRRNTQQWLNPE